MHFMNYWTTKKFFNKGMINLSYEQTTVVKVNEFLEDVSKRNFKIDSKINKIDSQISLLNHEISKRQESIVEYDLNEDVDSKNTVIKEIGKLKVKLNDLMQEKAAYMEAKKPGNSTLKEEAEKIKVAAEKEVEQIHGLIAKKRESTFKLQTQKDEIERNIKNQELELQNLEWNINNIENFEIPKITKYIEPEKNEDSYEDREPRAVAGQVVFATDDDSKPYTQQFLNK